MTQSLRALLALSLVLAVAGCDSGFRPLGFMDRFRGNDASDVPPPAVAEEVAEEEAVEAATGEEAEAPAPSAASGSLGTTIASLGDPTRPGLWLETPLVSAETAGTLVAENGNRIDVTLIPSGGAAGSGSRISVAAMQALGLGLTDLATLTVIAGG
ncbi:hypothetical protein [Nioella sp.]|uniref:hypothetical protein n=1 Tax=Nioella sp. TaxID=1912091 RepID=UPI0035175FA6